MLKGTNGKNIGLNLQLLLLGIISMSKICSVIFQDALHLPIIIPEIFWVVYLMINHKRYYRCFRVIENKYFLFAVVYVLIIALVSILSGRSLLEALSELRGIISLILFLILIVQYMEIDALSLWWLCFGAVLGDVFYILIFDVTHLTVNHMAWATCCIVCFIVKGKWKIPLTYGVCSIGAVISTYRINVILIIINLFVCVLWIILRKQKHSIKTLLFRIAMLIFSIFAVNYIYNNLVMIVAKLADFFNMTSADRYRIVNRLQMFLDGTAAKGTDSTRISLMKLIYDDFFVNILPAGIMNTKIYAKGVYQDTPMLILYNYFGSILSMLIVTFFIVLSTYAFIKAFKKDNLNSSYIYAGLIFPTMCSLLLTNGFFLISNYAAIITGIVVGLTIKCCRK